MSEQPHRNDDLIDLESSASTREEERERIRSSNDRDQAAERAGEPTPHDRGYDEAARGRSRDDVDPDSAESDVDRDDTIPE